MMANWIKNRGGIAIWNSVNLSNSGATWSTPALNEDNTPYQKPNWETANEPEKIITNTDDIIVAHDKEVTRFHVANRRSSNGMSFKVTDGGSRKIRSAVAKAGEGAYYCFDYSDYKNAVIMAPEKTETLTEWLKNNPV
jgi:hypothetical protein